MWAALIVVLSTATLFRMPRVQLGDIGPDKLAHFGVYAVLAGLLALGFSKIENRWPRGMEHVFILLGGTAFGVLMEGVQAWFVPERSYEYADMVANALGILAGWIAGLFIFK